MFSPGRTSRRERRRNRAAARASEAAEGPYPGTVAIRAAAAQEPGARAPPASPAIPRGADSRTSTWASAFCAGRGQAQPINLRVGLHFFCNFLIKRWAVLPRLCGVCPSNLGEFQALLSPSGDILVQAVTVASRGRRGELPVAWRGCGVWEEALGRAPPWGMGGVRPESLRPASPLQEPSEFQIHCFCFNFLIWLR